MSASTMKYPGESIGDGSGKISLFSGPGTRRWRRYNISELPELRSIRTSAGTITKVINISRSGVSLGTVNRMVPRARIQLEIKFVGGPVHVSGFVLRSSAVFNYGIPQYKAAVAFDRLLQLSGTNAKTEAVSLKTCTPWCPPHQVAAVPGEDLFVDTEPSEDSRMIGYFLSEEIWNGQTDGLFQVLGRNDW